MELPKPQDKAKDPPAKDDGIDTTAAMQGEAGRMARKQARDCMSGRYRP